MRRSRSVPTATLCPSVDQEGPLPSRLLPKGSKDSCVKAFGPKDHTTLGFWAILSLTVSEAKPTQAELCYMCIATSLVFIIRVYLGFPVQNSFLLLIRHMYIYMGSDYLSPVGFRAWGRFRDKP